MSTYNEKIYELEQSIYSICSQSYKNLEIIIINDNPNSMKNKEFLEGLSDNRITIIHNDKNVGLVRSLNLALQYAHGEYIARMDADDISLPNRIEDEYNYLVENNLDLVGAYVELIDENNNTIKSEMRFPKEHNRIERYIKWGSCICHPTWLAKKIVYDALGGYRMALHCEDYDFLNRAIIAGFRLGNIPAIELKYRIRSTGVSKTNNISQLILREFLSNQFQKNIIPSETMIDEYITSEIFFIEQKKYNSYVEKKQMLKSGNLGRKVVLIMRMCTDRLFWRDIHEKTILYLREK